MGSAHGLTLKLAQAQLVFEQRMSLDELYEQYGLTPREREVCALLLSTEPGKNIAKALGMSQATVSFHSKNLYRKCGVQSRIELSAVFGRGGR